MKLKLSGFLVTNRWWKKMKKTTKCDSLEGVWGREAVGGCGKCSFNFRKT